MLFVLCLHKNVHREFNAVAVKASLDGKERHEELESEDSCSMTFWDYDAHREPESVYSTVDIRSKRTSMIFSHLLKCREIYEVDRRFGAS